MYSKIILIERTRSEHCSYFENSDRKKKLKKTNYDVSSHFQSTNENRNRIRSDLHSQLIRTYLMRISFFFFFFFLMNQGHKFYPAVSTSVFLNSPSDYIYDYTDTFSTSKLNLNFYRTRVIAKQEILRRILDIITT